MIALRLRVLTMASTMVPVASIVNRVEELGAYLREQRQQAQLSLRQLAELAGVSNPYLSQIERGLKKPSAEVLQQIARGLHISSEALYERAGILEPSESGDLERAIQTERSLTERQRRVLLDIYRVFRAENAHTEPAHTEPARTEPARTEPAQAEPAQNDAVPADTALVGAATAEKPTGPVAAVADATPEPVHPLLRSHA